MTPDETTRMGRMLAAGSVTVTVTSKQTGKHLTVRIDCCRRGTRWERVPYALATHLFVNEEPHGTRIATFYPRNGEWRAARGFIDPALTWAGTNALKAALGLDASPKARYQESNQCGRCRRDLTDPVSIERGIGPECFAKTTGSRRADVKREPRSNPYVEGRRAVAQVEREQMEERLARTEVSQAPSMGEPEINDGRSPGERAFGDWLTKEFTA